VIRSIRALVRKELYQIRRDPLMLRLIFLAPVLQLFVLAYAISTDVKYVYTGVYDYDRTETSRRLVRTLGAGDYFVPSPGETPLTHSERNLSSGDRNANLIVRPGLGKDLKRGRGVTLGMVIDGANANSASIAMGYAARIGFRFNQQLQSGTPPVTLRTRVLYNPEGESVYFMVPGIVAVLLTMITLLLTSMAIVRERESGTLEQLMVSPLSTPALILGKIIPFALVGFLEMSIALAVGIFWFDIPFAGSWPLLYGLALVYILTTLGLGMWISTLTQTQQQAMFFAWFLTIFAILTSGFFIPIENMPEGIRFLTYLNPLRYFMTIVRGIMMKGAGLSDLGIQAGALGIYAVATFSLAWIRFSKRIR
jgi:ABC-2 type transport system permease protein